MFSVPFTVSSTIVLVQTNFWLSVYDTDNCTSSHSLQSPANLCNPPGEVVLKDFIFLVLWWHDVV